MEKFIPYKKMSKKKQKEINQKKRASWNGLNPVTRKSENRKAYNRKKVLKWNDDSSQDLFIFLLSAKKAAEISLRRFLWVFGYAPNSVISPARNLRSISTSFILTSPSPFTSAFAAL